ncbi:hypothetical protein CYLTODRAFT_488029 [Cylindrobasidium torrendii FP15055 ss-10]|uniref:Uncharacterized protein n=1 Tax=Cylindrobasidium torrendii FP15055 ss-10 TaxID=1314674 RepID=A0A0D7BJR1_9AGAR|nr:hypothetical protein CYLTODRAFT_488029 [Cylindrobasidium torrendii FP15055 ss-10]
MLTAKNGPCADDSGIATTTLPSTSQPDPPSGDKSEIPVHIPATEDTGVIARAMAEGEAKRKESKERKATAVSARRKNPAEPRIRTKGELKRRLPRTIKRLVKQWSYKPDRSIDTNAFLRPGHSWSWSRIYARGKNPFLLLWRISKDLGIIADVDSWMNIYQRDSESHHNIRKYQEAQCPTLGDIEAFIQHCKNNERLMAEGKKPISIFEASGFEPGTIFTYLVANFGRHGNVPFHATEDGSDVNFDRFVLVLDGEDTPSTRIQYTQGHPLYVISALLCTLRWRAVVDEAFFTKKTLTGEIQTGCKRIYDYAVQRRWFHPATRKEIAELVNAGVLVSDTCRKALLFQGITKGKTKPFFFSPPDKPSRPRPVAVDTRSQLRQSLDGVLHAAVPLSSPPPLPPIRSFTPTHPSRKRAPESPDGGSPSRPWKQPRLREHSSVLPNGKQKWGQYPREYVRELPLRAQNLSSHRPVRPPFSLRLVDGEYKWVLPEEWVKNPPANAYAPVWPGTTHYGQPQVQGAQGLGDTRYHLYSMSIHFLIVSCLTEL